MVGFKPRCREPRSFLGGLADARAAGYLEGTRQISSEKVVVRLDPRFLLGPHIGRQKLLTMTFTVRTGYLHVHAHEQAAPCAELLQEVDISYHMLLRDGAHIPVPDTCSMLPPAFRSPSWDDAPTDSVQHAVHPSFMALGDFVVPHGDGVYQSAINALAGQTASTLGNYPELRTLLLRTLEQLGATQIPPNFLAG